MQRLIAAFINSMRALRHLARNEKAVQQELAIFLLSIPVAAAIAPSALIFLLLTGSLLFLIMIEVLNTGIEAACDAVSKDFHKEIQIAKDCGSLAVLISVVLVAGIWLYILWSLYLA
ncbi:diacylglycerol kinase [Phyllobacterium sp. 21LDTY02-6]|jgi:diacylglycerol kinase (ATP)|uniref:diacylglycerol kinase n=1 Tax=unclassified Phyllobacterium TaxID=2638441 RepID=UPI002021A4D6|nr:MULTISPECIES: diacylglycerol kinase [unclassified Phyllobacterium]MCO4316186.1 diacylglycerol kinase [Phyllobacterium sp. 21LDTY02-6]MCX8279391.1 diacylglycerol kinase [Phyllobacterium sp. 0TCS1.6C]MCX8292418.1 diacylglycerol kinase [Phyllobacterium sp. 0TCS1.6A]